MGRVRAAIVGRKRMLCCALCCSPNNFTRHTACRIEVRPRCEVFFGKAPFNEISWPRSTHAVLLNQVHDVLLGRSD